jgi:four helix bundle protein
MMFAGHRAFSTWHLAFSPPGGGAELKDFRNLKVWAKAHEMTLAAYKATARFPREELFGLTSQIRRCSSSIGANIAEGCGKRGNGECQRFLQIASGSASESEQHLLLARDLNFLISADYQDLQMRLTELRKMLTALLQKVERERLMAKCQVPSATG